MKTIIIVSPHFPPSALAGVHRARHLAKHLPSHGWRPIVVRVDERHYTETGDPALARLVPESVVQSRTGALPARVARLVSVGDVGLRGYFFIKRALTALAVREKPHALLITGSPFYPMLLAGWAKRKLNIPVVLDFQDPWVSAEGSMLPRWTKGGLTHRLAVVLEPRAIRPADFVTSVSERQNEEMADRYPWLDGRRMAAIPIGGDPDDFVALRATPPMCSSVKLDSRTINVCYVGTFLPRAGPLVRAVFRALAELKRSKPSLATRMRFHFVGTSNQPDAYGLFRVWPIAEEEGVGDLVIETPQRVPFLEALQILAQSQGLLLIGSDEPHYTASKIYPALMSGRPYVSLFHAASSSHSILARAGGGRAFSFDAVEQLSSLVVPLGEALDELASVPECMGHVRPESYADYTADSIAGRFASVLLEVCRT